jgi:hypothetical protein
MTTLAAHGAGETAASAVAESALAIPVGACPIGDRQRLSLQPVQARAYGLEAGMGAKAIVTLPPPSNRAQLRVTDVGRKTFTGDLVSG